MGPEQINELLKKNDIAYQDIAKDLKIGVTSIGRVINKGASSMAVRIKICDMLGVQYEQMWGQTGERNDIGRAMSRDQIKVHLFKNESSQTKISKELAISQSAVSQVMSGAQTSIRVQYAICKAIGYPYEKVWEKAR